MIEHQYAYLANVQLHPWGAAVWYSFTKENPFDYIPDLEGESKLIFDMIDKMQAGGGCPNSG